MPTSQLVEASRFAPTITFKEAKRYLDLHSPPFTLKGMEPTSILSPHQIIGLVWMVRQESYPDRLGGILADSILYNPLEQYLSLIVATAHRSRAPTLIVVPSGSIGTVYDKIRGWVDRSHFKVLKYHGLSQKEKPDKRSLETRYDIVLVSYGTLNNSNELKSVVFERVILDDGEPGFSLPVASFDRFLTEAVSPFCPSD